jgi:hypothetical protein
MVLVTATIVMYTGSQLTVAFETFNGISVEVVQKVFTLKINNASPVHDRHMHLIHERRVIK